MNVSKILLVFLIFSFSLTALAQRYRGSHPRERFPGHHRGDYGPGNRHFPFPGQIGGHRPMPTPFPSPSPIPHTIPSPRPFPIPSYPPQPEQYPQTGNLYCRSSGLGFESHGAGHFSCGECLSWHAQCLETCREESFECEVQGQDYWGRLVLFRALGSDRFSAERESLRRCEWDRNVRSCMLVRCQPRHQIISQHSCR
jgi:hypothetical protein